MGLWQMWHYGIATKINVLDIIFSEGLGNYSYLCNGEEDNLFQTGEHSVEKLKIIMQKMCGHSLLFF